MHTFHVGDTVRANRTITGGMLGERLGQDDAMPILSEDEWHNRVCFRAGDTLRVTKLPQNSDQVVMVEAADGVEWYVNTHWLEPVPALDDLLRRMRDMSNAITSAYHVLGQNAWGDDVTEARDVLRPHVDEALLAELEGEDEAYQNNAESAPDDVTVRIVDYDNGDEDESDELILPIPDDEQDETVEDRINARMQLLANALEDKAGRRTPRVTFDEQPKRLALAYFEDIRTAHELADVMGTLQRDYRRLFVNIEHAIADLDRRSAAYPICERLFDLGFEYALFIEAPEQFANDDE